MTDLPNVVLVHGAWAWLQLECRRRAPPGRGLQRHRAAVPDGELAHNVAGLRARVEPPTATVVAGHSYGGQIMTALGTDAPNVVGLVYIAAFGLDEGESIGALLHRSPDAGAGALGHRLRKASRAARRRLRQPLRRRRRSGAGEGHVGSPAAPARIRTQRRDGRARVEVAPSWYLVAEGDQASARRRKAVCRTDGRGTIEVASDHVAMVSHPDEALERITAAAKSVAAG